MNLTPEARRIGRRNFLKAVAGTSALAALGTTAIVRGPVKGGPVRAALVGYGKQGRILHDSIDPELMDVAAICDIRPASQSQREQSDGVRWYQDWRRMLAEERIEAVLIATPLCTHSEIAAACLEAGKHVLCETAMAIDLSGCRRMIQASQKHKRLLAVGYQEYYQPHYWSAYRNIVKPGVLGDIYTVVAARHTNNSGRLAGNPEAMSIDPRPWGYASEEQLRNWRLYRRYSNGLTGEWGSALVSLTNWFLDAIPDAVQATGGIFSYKDGRDVDDHVYATLDYPQGRTATLSLLQSNGLERSYAQFMGTKGTLVIGADEALLFSEAGTRPASAGVAKLNHAEPVLDTSASRKEEASNHSLLAAGAEVDAAEPSQAFQQEIAAFCGAIRTGAALRCTPAHAYDVARTCLAIDRALEQGKRIIPRGQLAKAQSLSSRASECRAGNA